MLGYIKRFGFWRGIYFWRIARLCERDTHLLKSWSTHFRQKASAALRNDDLEKADAYSEWAETLQTTHEQLKGKKPKRAVLTKRTRKVEKRMRKALQNAR